MASLGRFVVRCCVLAALGLAPAAGADVNVDVHIGSAPPPPVIDFDPEPEVVLVPETRVYYVPGRPVPMYRYDDGWYVYQDGYWYRSKKSRGPFALVVRESVPTVILGLPEPYRPGKGHPHGGPPGQMKKKHGHGHD
jgi:hypothetical protein